MKTSTRSLLHVGLFALLASPAALFADLKLTFDVTHTSTPPSPKPELPTSAPKIRQFPLTVVLTENILITTGDTSAWFFDFAQRRIYQTSASDRLFSEHSLHAHVAAREIELRNRMALAQGLKASGIALDVGALDRVLFESGLSLRTPGSLPLRPDTTDERTVFNHGEKPLARFQLSSGFALDADEARHFTRFLRHRYSTHPDILDALQTLRLVPREFEIWRYEIGTECFRFELTKAERIEETGTLATFLDGRQPRPSSSSVFRAAQVLTPDDFKTRCDEARRNALVAAKAGRHLDALLLFLEYTLSTGEPLPTEMAPYRRSIEADPDCRRYFASSRPATKDATELTIKTLQELETKTSEGRAVLKILRANHLTALNRRPEAAPLFESALAEKIHLTGAWRDLGFVLVTSFRADEAWQWWDAARRLHPSARSAWRAIDAAEDRLATQYPQFF